MESAPSEGRNKTGEQNANARDMSHVQRHRQRRRNPKQPPDVNPIAGGGVPIVGDPSLAPKPDNVPKSQNQSRRNRGGRKADSSFKASIPLDSSAREFTLPSSSSQLNYPRELCDSSSTLHNPSEYNNPNPYPYPYPRELHNGHHYNGHHHQPSEYSEFQNDHQHHYPSQNKSQNNSQKPMQRAKTADSSSKPKSRRERARAARQPSGPPGRGLPLPPPPPPQTMPASPGR